MAHALVRPDGLVQNEYRDAQEIHFHRDAEHFIEVLRLLRVSPDSILIVLQHAQEIEAHKHHGLDLEKMTWEHFKAQMHRFMEMKTTERQGLLSVAKHIF